MKNAIYRISLDIHEHSSQAVLKAKQTDIGRKVHITLREGSTPYTIEDDCYAVFRAKRQDGTILYNTCTIEDNQIIYEFTENTCAAVGRCGCEIALYSLDDKPITSPRFTLLVDGLIYPDKDVESSDEFSALTELLVDTRKVIENAEGAADKASGAADTAINAADNANGAANSANGAAKEATDAASSANAVANDLVTKRDSGFFTGPKGDKGDKGDPGIVNIDDTAVGANAWSSKNTIDKLCPAFVESGAIVTCEPVEGYPLDVVSQIVFVQEGSGTPSSDNIRPIQGCSGANLTHNDAAFSVDFGETVYSGTYNWTTGLLTITHKLAALTPDMGWIMTGDKNPNGIKSFYTETFDANARDDDMKNSSVSSHYRVYEGGWSVNSVSYAQAIKVLNNRIYIADARFHDLASFKAFIEANEVQLLYWLISPITVQLSKQEFLGLAGENTFHSDTGDTTVTGRADPTAIINKLTNAIVALGANI